MLRWLRSTETEDNSIYYPPFIAVLYRNDDCVSDALAFKFADDFFFGTASKITRSDYTFTRVEASVRADFHWHISQ